MVICRSAKARSLHTAHVSLVEEDLTTKHRYTLDLFEFDLKEIFAQSNEHFFQNILSSNFSLFSLSTSNETETSDKFLFIYVRNAM